MAKWVVHVQAVMYGELENGVLRTARIPPFYQSCNSEGGLVGCLVAYDNPHQQCSERKNERKSG